MKNRIIALILIAAICLSAFIACKSKDRPADTNDIHNGSNENGESDMENEKKDNIKLNLSVIKTTDVDGLLARPYTKGVPTAFSEGLFSTYTKGWGFENGTVLATGNSQGIGLPVTVKLNGSSVMPTSATWMPSHVVSTYESAKSYADITAEATISASYTSQYDTLSHITDGVISYTDNPRSRWSNYVSPASTQNEIITLDFGKTVTCAGFDVYFYDDQVNTVCPQSVSAQYYDGTNWVSVKNSTCTAISRTTVTELRFDTVKTTAVRLVLTPKSGKSVAITELKALGKTDKTATVPNGVIVEEKKFITENDLVVSYLTFKNNTGSSISIELTASPNKGVSEEKFGYRYIQYGSNADGTSKTFTLDSGKNAEYRFIVAVADKKGECQNKISNFLASKNPLENHVSQFNAWFEKNIPYQKYALNNHRPSKQSFGLSKNERKMVNRLIYLYKNGLMSMEEPPKEEEKYYDIWEYTNESSLTQYYPGLGYQAPKRELPDTDISYNPPNNEKESILRKVPKYEKLIEEEMERCCDLFLNARTIKKKIDLKESDIMPDLPKPEELRPFPTKETILFKGHSSSIKALCCDPNNLNVLISADNGNFIHFWDIKTAKIIVRFTLKEKVHMINYNKFLNLVVICTVSHIFFVLPAYLGKNQKESIMNMINEKIYPLIQNKENNKSRYKKIL